MNFAGRLIKFFKLSYKLSVFLLLLAFVALVIFAAKLNHGGVSFEIFNYKVYTTSGFILATFAIFLYIVFKTSFIFLRFRYLFEIRKMRYQYKQSLYKTHSKKLSIEISKSIRTLGGKNFIKLLNKDLTIENLPYYKFYTKNMSVFRKLIIAKKIYNNNQLNSTAIIIYAMALRDAQKYSIAKKLLSNFIENNSIAIENTKSMYIMCKIIVECESHLSSSKNFVKKYLDYIDQYDKTSK
jgi:hypothetical protein